MKNELTPWEKDLYNALKQMDEDIVKTYVIASLQSFVDHATMRKVTEVIKKAVEEMNEK